MPLSRTGCVRSSKRGGAIRKMHCDPAKLAALTNAHDEGTVFGARKEKEK